MVVHGRGEAPASALIVDANPTLPLGDLLFYTRM